MASNARFLIVVLLWSIVAGRAAAEPPPAAIAATVETTLKTSSGQIRQFAFDGNPDTYFLSAENASKADHFTLVFDKAVAVKSIAVTTGGPKGANLLDKGVLEVSVDGKKFEDLARFDQGSAAARLDGRKIRAVRIRPSEDLQHPLAIRDFAVDSDPPLKTFKYPVEYVVEEVDDPEMKDWFAKVARLCEREYSMIAEELRSGNFKPPTVVKLRLKNDYKGVAACSGSRITGSVAYFKAHQDDVGAFIHETVHVIQDYRTPGNPGWLVEGIADYIRNFVWDPVKPKPLRPEQAKYNGSYRVSAAFLAFLTEKYDRGIVRKLNQAMREGEYKEELFKALTRKTLPELEQEWQASLKR